MIRVVLLLSIILLTTPDYVVAESRAVVLDASIESGFKPEEVLFLATINNEPAVMQQGLLLANSNRETNTWRAGAVIKSDTAVTRLQYSILVHGESNQFWMKHYPAEELDEKHPRLQTVAGLRTAVVQAKSQQKVWETNLQEDKDELRRLRSDAEVIGNLGRITRLLEQVDLLQEEKERLVSDIDRLKGFLLKASTQPPPDNFIRRQAELTGQLEELARVVQGVEENEYARRSLSEAELQRSLALIEETRLADAGELESQLKQLQEARRRLESELGFDEGESVENYLSW